MEIRWARSATRHRISRKRSGHVVATANTVIRQPAPEGSPLSDERLVFLGRDEDGELLEVMAVETENGLLIIHAMNMRAKYEPYVRDGAEER
jgi:hypothetical protein